MKALSPPPPPWRNPISAGAFSGVRTNPNWDSVIPQAASTGPLSLGTSILVPPTPVDQRESAGIEAAPTGDPTPKSPLSPVATLTAIPRAAAPRKTWSNNCAVPVSAEASACPQLLEMTLPRRFSAAYSTADARSPSSSVGATTTTILAPGAKACAHSTSSVVSVAQSALVVAGFPLGYSTLRLFESIPGNPMVSENVL